MNSLKGFPKILTGSWPNYTEILRQWELINIPGSGVLVSMYIVGHIMFLAVSPTDPMYLGYLPHSFQTSFFQESHPKPWGNSWFLKRRMVEKNGKGKNTPRMCLGHISSFQWVSPKRGSHLRELFDPPPIIPLDSKQNSSLWIPGRQAEVPGGLLCGGAGWLRARVGEKNQRCQLQGCGKWNPLL